MSENRSIAEHIREQLDKTAWAAREKLDGREICDAEMNALNVRAMEGMTKTINAFAVVCHMNSANAGWWNDPNTGEPLIPDHVNGEANEIRASYAPYVIATKLMLMVSEIAEAMEGHRKGLNDDKLKDRPMIEVELADAVIRICDLAGALGLDLGGAIAAKIDFNATRPDHQTVNRRKPGGKAY